MKMKAKTLCSYRFKAARHDKLSIRMHLLDGYFNHEMIDGKVMIAVVADAILVYDGATGDMLAKPIRGAHKDTITCIASSKDSKRFATGR